MRYFEAKGKNIHFEYRREYPSLSKAERDSVKKYWHEQQLSERKIFNGSLLCANGIVSEDDNSVVIGYNRSNFATYTYMRDHALTKPGTYGMGDATVIFEQESNSYIFVERTGKVKYDKGKISIGSGGSLPAPAKSLSNEDFMQYVRDHAMTETDEELIAHELGETELLGLYLDEITHKVEFIFSAIAFSVTLPLESVENRRIIRVPKGEVAQFHSNNRTQLETTTRYHLDNWANALDCGI